MSDDNSIVGKGWHSAVKGLIMLVGLGVAVYLLRSSGIADQLADTHWVRDHLLGTGPMSIIIYVGVVAAYTALGMPRQVVAFLGGFVFGAWWGTLLSTLGMGIGCALVASYSRFAGQEFVRKRFGSRAEKVDSFLTREPFTMALAIRMFPVGSNLVTNLAAGISSIPIWPFVMGSVLGYLPQNLIFALFGAGMDAESTMGAAMSIGVSVVLFVISGWLGVVLYRRYRSEGVSLEE